MAEISPANGGDEGFGDFKFASFPNPTVSFNQIGGTDFADDEWGDFVVHPLSNGLSHIQSSSNPSQTSKPFDPFGFFPDDSSKPSESVVSQVDSVPIRSKSEKKQWVKPRGALSLSIFGEEEEEKESDSSEPAHTIDHKRVDSAKHGPKVDPVVGINDIISKLYSQSQQIKAENGSPAVSNGRNLNSNSDSNVLHADLVDGDDAFHDDNDDDDDDDDGWEFKSAVSENSKVQVGSGLLELEGETTTKQEMQAEQENSVGGKYSSGFPNALDGSSDFFAPSSELWQESSDGANRVTGFHNAPDSSSDFFAPSSELWQESSDGANRVTGFHNAPDSSSDFFAAPNGLWQENFKGAKNSSGFHGPPHNSTSFFDASNGLWQESERTKNTYAPDNSSGFFDASNGLWQESKGSGSHIAPGNSRDLFDASIGLCQEPEGAKHASGSHNGPDSSNDFFDASNGLWQEKTEAAKLPSGFNNVPDSSGVVFAASDELWQEKSGGAKHTSGFINAPNISADFFATSNGLWQDNAEGTKISSGIHNVSNSSTDPFSVSNGISYEPIKLNVGFDFKPTTLAQNDSIADSNSTAKQVDSENMLKPCLDDENVDPDESFGEFKDAFSETASKHKENEGRPANHMGALPMTLFSTGELETDDSLNHQDFWAFKANSNPRNGIARQASNMPINDLISTLYNQSKPSTSVDSAQKPSENGFSLAETVLDSNAVNDNDDFDDDSWEFKDAFSGAKAEDLTSGHSSDNAFQNFSTKVELKDYVDFYLKLKDKSCSVALCHLDSLKKAKTAAALFGEDVRVEALDKEIKEACKELSQENMLPKEVYLENGPPTEICLDGFLEDLCGPKFQALESEYHLSRRLSLAEKDLRSAVELFKHATSILKILMMGSMEEQSKYVSTWSKMISVCAQELKHGASIWKQSLQKNVYSQILLEPRGQKFILALGEIYRVVEVLGASARLFKPWLLLSSEKVDIFDLLEECSTVWSSLGLEDALHCLCDPFGFEYDGTVHALLASIKYVHDLDVLSLQNHVFTQQKPTCQMSLLTPEMVPGMKMVVWNGNHYFLTLSNLWANRISSDPPKLPDLQIG